MMKRCIICGKEFESLEEDGFICPECHKKALRICKICGCLFDPSTSTRSDVCPTCAENLKFGYRYHPVMKTWVSKTRAQSMGIDWDKDLVY
jgi:predicted amidophosphoribosyltransferase